MPEDSSIEVEDEEIKKFVIPEMRKGRGPSRANRLVQRERQSLLELCPKKKPGRKRKNPADF